MAEPLHVLIIDDSADDCQLVVNELRAGGLEVSHERVDCDSGVRSALAQGGWDIVISDYSMPGFGGLAALALVQQADPDLPFILISGTMGEEIAVSAMQAGAGDYIVKEHLPRLVPAVLRELREARTRRERRIAEDSLRRQSAYDALRADIWRLAAQSADHSGDPIQGLLERVGPALSVSRACYNAFEGGDPDHGDAVCTYEWCASGVSPSLGARMPSAIARHFLHRDGAVLDGESALALAPPLVRPLLKPAVEMLKRAYNIESVFALPFPPEGPIEGVLSFDVCRSQAAKPAPVDEMRTIVREVAAIVANHLSRRKAEEALRESEQKYRSLVDSANEAILVAQEGMIRFINRKAVALMGYSEQEFMARPFLEFIHPDDRQTVGANYLKRLKGEPAPETYAFRVLPKTGSAIWMEINAVLIAWKGAPATLNLLTDITERRKATQAIRDSEERYRTLFHDAVDGIVLADAATGAIIDCNEAICRMVERDKSELVGQSQAMLHDPHDLIGGLSPSFRQHQARSRGLVLEEHVLNKGGQQIPVEIRAARVQLAGHDYLLGIFRDLTEREQAEKERLRLEAQVAHSQKMETVGQLAGGIAHDFNNLLTAILGYTALVADSLPPDSSVRPNLAQVQAAGLRAADLTRQLLLFSRREPMQPLPINLNRTIDRMLKMLRRVIGEDVKVSAALSEKPWVVRADEGKIEQVIMNLAVNARDAMPTGGELTLFTENVHLDAAQAAAMADGRPGEFVRISATDTGTGMDEAVLHHLFDPFFTTKVVGKGTGLGLSVVYGIVKQHEGWIAVATALGKGTTFAVYLPAEPGVKPVTRSVQAPLEALRGNGERVLLVEDDEAVRELAQEILAGNGYEVVAAASLTEGLRCFKDQAGRFALLFSDVVLPDGTGLQVVDQVRAMAPHIPVLLASGYTDEKSQAEIINGRGLPFIRKPYDVAGLLAAVRGALSGKERS